MSEWYNPFRSRNVYDPMSSAPFRLSRSKIDLYKECQRCFYLDRRLGVARPPGFPFSLNNAVDTLLKKEFDLHRARGSRHPIADRYSVDAVPFQHERMDEWRDALRRGITHLVTGTNLLVTGGVDDVWVNPAGELIIVDYKATSKEGDVGIDADWQDGYRRQMEVYQWLFRQNGFRVSPTGYFVYCNGRTDRAAFDGKLEFEVSVHPYTGSTDWIEPAIRAIYTLLRQNTIPEPGSDCDYCLYRRAVREKAGEV